MLLITAIGASASITGTIMGYTATAAGAYGGQPMFGASLGTLATFNSTTATFLDLTFKLVQNASTNALTVNQALFEQVK
jgi:hypothetical protein